MRLHVTSMWLGAMGVLALAACVAEEGDKQFQGADTGQTGSGGTGATTSTGVGGSTPAGCVPGDTDRAVDASCGVFVSSTLGSDASDGSKEAPVASLAAAMDLAKTTGKPIYACAEAFSAAVAITTPVTIYGGLDCAGDWAYAGPAKKTTLTAPADEVPLRVSADAAGTALHDLAIQATDATTPGGSSIAMIAEGAAVEMVRCDVVAGNGAAGLAGAEFPGAAQAGDDGWVGLQACSADQIFGGNETLNSCGDLDSIGGSGGNGQQSSGGAGSPGVPLGAPNAGTGEAGGTASTPGTKGDDGLPGTDGPGASGLGTLSTSGHVGVAGDAGAPGQPAQGGGGGGGAKGGTGANQCPSLPGQRGGASGGGGAAGGCGGAGGLGGMPGGSSIAIVSLDATLTFKEVTLSAAQGAAGGAGGDGQPGGAGGIGGSGGTAPSGLNAASPGGDGGLGGTGGRGGGGTGGHSIGIAFSGSAPDAETVVITLGTPGTGGSAAAPQGQGASGTAAPIQGF